MRIRRLQARRLAFGFLTAALLIGGVEPLWLWRTADGAEFTSRAVYVDNNVSGAAAQYKLTFGGQSGGPVGSIRLQLCTNDPFPGRPCTAPAGLDIRGATLTSQTGMTGFSIAPGTTANELVLTRTPTSASSGVSTYVLGPVINPSQSGSVYGRLETFATSDATGPHHDAAGLAIAYLPSLIAIRSVVPPYLLFCVGNTIQGDDCTTAQGSYIDFGELSPVRTATGQTQLVVATNADFGFTVTVQGTTMTSGVNVIPQLATADVSRQGVSQFGLNLRANSTPAGGQEPQGLGLSSVLGSEYGRPNFYAFNPGDVLVRANDPDMEKYTITYILNVAKSQAAGVYVSTLTYTALASF